MIDKLQQLNSLVFCGGSSEKSKFVCNRSSNDLQKYLGISRSCIGTDPYPSIFITMSIVPYDQQIIQSQSYRYKVTQVNTNFVISSNNKIQIQLIFMGCVSVGAGRDMSINLSSQEKEKLFADYCQRQHVPQADLFNEKEFLTQRIAYNRKLLQRCSHLCSKCVGKSMRSAGYLPVNFNTCENCHSTGLANRRIAKIYGLPGLLKSRILPSSPIVYGMVVQEQEPESNDDDDEFMVFVRKMVQKVYSNSIYTRLQLLSKLFIVMNIQDINKLNKLFRSEIICRVGEEEEIVICGKYKDGFNRLKIGGQQPIYK